MHVRYAFVLIIVLYGWTQSFRFDWGIGVSMLPLVALWVIISWIKNACAESYKYERLINSLLISYKPTRVKKIFSKLKEDGKASFREEIGILYLLLQKKNKHGAELVLELGMNINAKFGADSSETTLLQTLCLEPHPDLYSIKFLLEHGADPDLGSGFPPMINALAWGNEDLIQLLLSYGATPGGMGKEINAMNNTPLHSLCSNRRDSYSKIVLKRAKELIDSGVNVNAMTAGNFTPLDVALEQKADEEELMNEAVNAMPLYYNLLDLLRTHGALRGAQIMEPNPHFDVRLYIKGDLPTDEKIDSICQSEPKARVECFHQSCRQEGLAALLLKSEMKVTQQKDCLAHTCYIELHLEEYGADPIELGTRLMKLALTLARSCWCVGIDCGENICSVQQLRELEDSPGMLNKFFVSIEGKSLGNEVYCVRSRGMRQFGLMDIIYTDSSQERAKSLLQNFIIPVIFFELRMCVEDGHRVYVSPKFSLVAKNKIIEGNEQVISFTPDHNHYRD